MFLNNLCCMIPGSAGCRTRDFFVSRKIAQACRLSMCAQSHGTDIVAVRVDLTFDSDS
jgi:hypothetical protein